MKFQAQEFYTVSEVLQRLEKVTFNTYFERKLSAIILKRLLVRMKKKLIEPQLKFTFNFTDDELLVIQHVIQQCPCSNTLEHAIITDFIRLIDIECQSISSISHATEARHYLQQTIQEE